MSAKIILLRIKYPENLGLIARVMKNFGLNELYLVNPRVSPENKIALIRSSHASNILKKAKIISFDEALKKSTYSIAFTSRKSRSINRKHISLNNLSKKFSLNEDVALVFGPEDDSLSNEEINECDFSCTIPSNLQYPSLNISHAIAITLFQLFHLKQSSFIHAKKFEKQKLLELFKQLIERIEVRNKVAVERSFKSLISRSFLEEKEAKALIVLFKKLLKK